MENSFVYLMQTKAEDCRELKALAVEKNHEIIITSSPELVSGDVTETQRKLNW